MEKDVELSAVLEVEKALAELSYNAKHRVIEFVRGRIEWEPEGIQQELAPVAETLG